MRWVGSVTRVTEKKNAHRILVGNLIESNHLGNREVAAGNIEPRETDCEIEGSASAIRENRHLGVTCHFYTVTRVQRMCWGMATFFMHKNLAG